MKNVLRILSLAILLVVVCVLSVQAATADDVKVTSTKMTYSANGQSVVFTGNVVVKHPQADMWANTVTVYLQSDSPAKTESTVELSPGKVKEIVAVGNVRIKLDKNRVGTSQKVVYILKNELIVMTGSPKLSEGKNTITGTTIKFWVKENRSEVLGSASKPVEAIFTAPGKGKK